MTVKDKELKKLGDQIDELEDNEIKRQLSISYKNIMHNNGQLPCDGIWNFQTGECDEFDETTIPPKVSAGRNRTIDVGESLTLSGEVKDFKNYLSYKGWQQITHPGVSLVEMGGSADGSTITIKPVNEGEYTFVFEAIDIKGQKGSDTIVVTVKSAESRKAAKKAKEEEEKSVEDKPSLMKIPSLIDEFKPSRGSKIEEKPEPELFKSEFRGKKD